MPRALTALAAIAGLLATPFAPVAAQGGAPVEWPGRVAVLPGGNYDPAVPTMAAVLGHEHGQVITPPDRLLAYFEALAAAVGPGRMRLVRYATSWEGRPLVYAILTAPANMARIDDIKAANQALGEGPAPAAAEALMRRALPVTWLAYSVHGDEISGADASAALAYHLLASRGDERVDTILANSVVIIDPSQNPDGRNRFVNSHAQQLGIMPSASRDTAGPDQPWPGGRFNHYLFDLNRDWFALTQPETRGKVAAVLDWHPVVLADVHEMGGDTTYYFPPAAEPFNPYITATQRERQQLLGRGNAAALDALGVDYFTREVFDAFYPGYGDTWPTLNGAIAMTFEQSSARGLVFERRDGSLLTYAEGVRNQFATSLASAETVARNAQLFLADYARYRREGASGAVGSASYLIDLGTRRWNAEQLGRRLAAQGIEVTRVDGPANACGRSYPAGYLAVSQRQPAARLVRSLLDRQIDLPADFLAAQERRRADALDHQLYDTTAWSVGLMSGLAVESCANAAAGTPLAADAPVQHRAAEPGALGLVVPWSDSGQARLVARALVAGHRGRVSEEAFTIAGRTFPRGSVVFTRAANDGDLSGIVALAQEIGAETVPLDSGWVDDGPNPGSAAFATLTAPRVAMLWDDGVSPLSAGATRYVIEQRLGIPVAAIRTGRVARADLAAFDVLIAPEGNPASALGAQGQAAIARFVREGGVLVAYGEALAAMSQGDNALFATSREVVLGGEPAKEEERSATAPGVALEDEAAYEAAIEDGDRAPDSLPGALLNTAADPNHFLAAGYDGAAPVVVADGNLVLTPLSRGDGVNVIRFAGPEALVASGHVWDENRRQLAFKPYLMAQPNGEGLAIGFVHDPAVRGYLDGLDLLLANAVLIAPSRVR